MNDREFIAVFHYDNGGTNRCGAEPYRYAEEIVRCKDCKFWKKVSNCMSKRSNGYCDEGKRSEP